MTGYESKKNMAQDKLAQPAQEPVAWKLMPRDATDAMLKAMDECSTEGYDERLYAGHAASVYMAAWDEALYTTPPQPAQEPVTWGVDWGKAGDIPCASIIKRLPNGSIEVMAVEYAPHSYTTPPQPAQKPMAWIEKDMQCDDFDPDSVTCEKPARAADGWEWIPLYTTPPQRPWVGLTEEDFSAINQSCFTKLQAATSAESILKDKNT